MGIERKVRCVPGGVPSWLVLAQFLAERGLPVQLRMIDGELAFPDEEPKPDWRELRVGTPGGMITMRRDQDEVTLVTWGNADEAMRQAWNALAWALAKLSDGVIETHSGTRFPDQFASSAELPPTFR